MVGKIAFFLPDLNAGGAERAALLLAQAWPTAPSPLVIVRNTSGRYGEDSRIIGDVRIVSLGLARSGISSSLRTPRRLGRIVREHEISTVVSFLSLPSVLATRCVARDVEVWASIQTALGRRAVAGSRGRLEKLQQWGLAGAGWFAICRVDGVFVPCDGMRRCGPVRRCEEAGRRVVTLPNPVDPQLLSVSARGGRIGLPHVVTAGRLVPRKRFDVFLKAISEVSRVQPVRATIFGEGPSEECLKGLVGRLGLREVVTFRGYVSEQREIYEDADVFVMTSDYEGFGNVVAEALAVGLPVVSTEAPYGPADILNHGEFGVLAGCGDWRGIANGILACLPGGPEHERLRSRARERSRLFAAPDVAKRMYTVLAGLGDETGVTGSDSAGRNSVPDDT